MIHPPYSSHWFFIFIIKSERCTVKSYFTNRYCYFTHLKPETEKYKKEKEAKTVLIPFRADRQFDYGVQKFYRDGYLFPQSVYYGMQMQKICRKLKAKYKFKYDINAILSDLVYARILEPASRRSSYKTAIPETSGVTYSPKYSRYQKAIWEKQVERAEKMLASGNTKKTRKNPNENTIP